MIRSGLRLTLVVAGIMLVSGHEILAQVWRRRTVGTRAHGD